MHCFSSFLSSCLVVAFVLQAVCADIPDDYELPPAPGPYVSPGSTAEGFSRRQPIVLTSYFYWYDVETKSHIVNPDGSDALTTHPPTLDGLSYRNPAWHRQQLDDMARAGIDVVLPVYWGTPGVSRSWSNVGLPPLVAARERLLSNGRDAPKIGMFYDTSTLRHNPRDYHVDLRTAAGRRWFHGTIRDFFSLVPPRHRACIEGRPIVVLYASAFAAGVDEDLFARVREMFRSDFGTDLYLIKMQGWPGEADSVYMWGGALKPRYLDVAAIGPGYDHSAVPGRDPLVRERENGLFYMKAWERLLAEPVATRPGMVHVETWNEWHEGTDICESREYGRKYIELTRKYADLFHARRQVDPEHVPPAPKQVKGSPGHERGIQISPHCEGDGPVAERKVAGRNAWSTLPNDHSSTHRYLYFDVDDRFLGLGDKAVKVTVCYLDSGPGHFTFQYDSADPRLSGVSQRFREGHVQPIRDSGKWKEVSFVVPHALFAGRANGDDFRLACADAELIIHSITMQRAEDDASGTKK